MGQTLLAKLVVLVINRSLPSFGNHVTIHARVGHRAPFAMLYRSLIGSLESNPKRDYLQMEVHELTQIFKYLFVDRDSVSDFVLKDDGSLEGSSDGRSSRANHACRYRR